MSELGNRSGAVLPTPIEAWEHNNLNGRRLLPSPGPKKEYTVGESDKARSVRLLLAKHGEQVNHVLNLSGTSKISRGSANSASNNLERPSSTEDNSEDYHTVVPGDSFPMTGNNLVAISLGEIDDCNEEASEDEQELLKRLGQGQARMEQIKRMLVNQRGFIVQALKQLTESNTSNRDVRSKFAQQIREQKEAIEQLASEPRECTKCNSTRQLDKDSADDEASMERDRTLGKGSLVHFGLNDSSSEEWPPNGLRRMCPMCEAAFPPTVTDEDFEMHVMEHFTFEEQETLKYIPPPAPQHDNGHDISNM